MSKHWFIFFLFALLTRPSFLTAQEGSVEATVAVSIQQQDTYWVGQQLTIDLDLKTTGFSFSNTHFNLPEVRDAFLMQTDTTTIKLSEKREGKTWQIIRYPLALYPQKSGSLKIPPISVRFSSSAGFGSTVKDFELETEALELMVSLPPGVGEDELVVSTGSFQLEHNWQGQTENAKTGDAFTLIVKRRASDISAMLLPPLPVYEASGLAAYPQTPEIRDVTDRGSLTGERTDSNIWVAERAGSYEIPGIRFQWWDPDNRELKQQVVPGITLDILPARNDVTGVATKPVSETQASKLLTWMILLTTAIVTMIFWRKRRKPVKHQADERTTFTILQNACKSNQAAESYSAMHAWLAYAVPISGSNPRGRTLAEFARSMKDEQLEADVKHLQTMMVNSPPDWQGRSLLYSLKRIRRNFHAQKAVQSQSHLAPLNP